MREGKRNQDSRFERLSVILRVRLFSRRLARAKNGQASARFARGKDAFFDLNFSHARTDMESIRGEARWQELKRFRISLRMIHKELAVSSAVAPPAAVTRTFQKTIPFTGTPLKSRTVILGFSAAAGAGKRQRTQKKRAAE